MNDDELDFYIGHHIQLLSSFDYIQLSDFSFVIFCLVEISPIGLSIVNNQRLEVISNKK